MKKIKIFCLIIFATVLLQFVPIQIYATQQESPEQTVSNNYSDDSSVSSGCRGIDAQSPLWGSGKLLATSAAAILYEANSDTLIYAWNPDEKMVPASLVKIMTALIAVEKGNLQDKIIITEGQLSAIPENNRTLELQPGENVTLEQLLYCLLVGSANDASVVIAAHIAGSEENFVSMMNERAKELGCTSTNFKNSHGLTAENQYTTARDIAKILKVAMKNETFMEFFSATLYYLPATNLSEKRRVETTNYIMTPGTPAYYDKRVTGGRTGITDDRNRVLAVTAESGGLSFVGVVLGAVPTYSKNGYSIKYFGSYEEMNEMLNTGFDDLKIVQVLNENQILRQYAVANGENSLVAGPAASLETVLPTGTKMEDLTIRYLQGNDVLTAPIQTGDQITTVQLWYKDVCIAQMPLVARNTVDVFVPQDEQKQSLDANGGFGTALIIIGIILGFVLAIVCVVYIVQFLRNAASRAQHRRRRRNRRRSK